MNHVDMFTGQPTLQAEQMAAFGQQIYQQNPQMVNIGGVGYNPGYYSPSMQGSSNYGSQMNPALQAMGNPQYQYSQGFGGGATLGGNPTLPQPPMGMYRPITPEEVTFTIPGFDPFGTNMLLPEGYEDIILKLQIEAYMEDCERPASNTNFGYGYQNYYGYNYGPNIDRSIYQKYLDKVAEIHRDAEERTLKFKMNLSRLAHNFLGEEISDDEIREIYTDKVVAIPNYTTEDVYEQRRLHNLVPCDNSIMYQRIDQAISDKFHSRIPRNADLNTFLENLALVAYDWEIEEAKERRRKEIANTYDSAVFRRLVKKKALEIHANDPDYVFGHAERSINEYLQKQLDAAEKGASSEAEAKKNKVQALLDTGLFPTMSQFASVGEDGSLNISFRLDKIADQPPEPDLDHKTSSDRKRSSFRNERHSFEDFLAGIPPCIISDR